MVSWIGGDVRVDERAGGGGTYDDTDDDVEGGGESLAEQERTGVEPRVLHLGHDGKAVRRTQGQ